MFSFKFIVRSDKNDDLRLRITNNRVSTQLSMGLKISPDELEAALSGSSRNILLEKMLASWTSQIKDLMLELANKKEADKDVKDIRTILQERLLGGHQWRYAVPLPCGPILVVVSPGWFEFQ